MNQGTLQTQRPMWPAICVVCADIYDGSHLKQQLRVYNMIKDQA